MYDKTDLDLLLKQQQQRQLIFIKIWFYVVLCSLLDFCIFSLKLKKKEEKREQKELTYVKFIVGTLRLSNLFILCSKNSMIVTRLYLVTSPELNSWKRENPVTSVKCKTPRNFYNTNHYIYFTINQSDSFGKDDRLLDQRG